MEVPTILFFLKQKVDIPVPRGGERRLQGFLPEQSSTAYGSGGLQDSRPGQDSAASSSVSRSPADARKDVDELFRWVFRTYSRPKKSATFAAQSSTELGAHSSSKLRVSQEPAE